MSPDNHLPTRKAAVAAALLALATRPALAADSGLQVTTDMGSAHRVVIGVSVAVVALLLLQLYLSRTMRPVDRILAPGLVVLGGVAMLFAYGSASGLGLGTILSTMFQGS